MPELRATKIIHVFYFWVVVVNASPFYTEFLMENDKICHPFSAKGNIRLPDVEDGAAIVKPNHMFDPWKVTSNKLCKYVFKTHRHTGLFAVIQTMSLRRNGSECIDYVQFKEDKHKSKLFCGGFDHRHARYHASGGDEGAELNLSHPEFKSAKGEIETYIFISKEKLLPGEVLDLTIVYTPYKDCNKLKDINKYRLNSNNTCISENYYCDGYRNCAFDSCLDEAGCEIVSNGTGTKVTVGAVTTLFLTFLLFVMCLWTCRKHKKLCWSPDCAGPNIAGANPPSTDSRQRDPSGRSVVPTAPMLEEATTRPVHDKDLPPSYDSLFPDQPIPAAT